MKVLLCVRHNYLESYAGDSVQAEQTARFLNNAGIEAKINSGFENDFSKYDIIHLFNLTAITETWDYYMKAEQAGKPVVITPVYWNLSRFYEHMSGGRPAGLRNRDNAKRKRILHACSAIFPSSAAELRCLQNEFGHELPYEVVYNGVDEKYFSCEQVIVRNLPQILCVARICPRKNQLALARVCGRLGLKLILVGNVNNERYFKQCMEFKNVEYLGFLQPDELKKAYARAGLHVLPSFVETPGLASLEAAACGCNIVTTCEGSAKEYFADMAQYCNPYDEGGIENSVVNALSINCQPKLTEHIHRNFCWEHCLQKLCGIYNTHL